ncbi:type II toxin-antitoxin system RelB/DinJ family antitoxin [Levilactobacillus andaensis]|uniref:type II toxin-antitoxin system RelB/DinJ family antitoxin n=1 Tax=Levilactobacillus andaensis TaxID=2799570 RepID=UPI00194240C4|nr:type II toxin-antitoxin system RelB/DinJ family antitoxin [Levilactobacillus andaensis]
MEGIAIKPTSKPKTRLTIRVDHDLKQQAEVIAEAMGTNLPNLVNMFLAQLVNDNGMPFKPTHDKAVTEFDKAPR